MDVNEEVKLLCKFKKKNIRGGFIVNVNEDLKFL